MAIDNLSFTGDEMIQFGRDFSRLYQRAVRLRSVWFSGVNTAVNALDAADQIGTANIDKTRLMEGAVMLVALCNMVEGEAVTVGDYATTIGKLLALAGE